MPCSENYQDIETPFLCAACKLLTIEQLKNIRAIKADEGERPTSYETLLDWYLDHLELDFKYPSADTDIKEVEKELKRLGIR